MFNRLKVQPRPDHMVWGADGTTMIGVNLARKLDKKLGDPIELYGKPFQIVGVYESPLDAENNGLVVSIRQMQQLSDHPGEVTGFFVCAEPNDEAGLGALRQRLEAVQPGLQVTIAKHSTRNHQLPVTDRNRQAVFRRTGTQIEFHQSRLLLRQPGFHKVKKEKATRTRQLQRETCGR